MTNVARRVTGVLLAILVVFAVAATGIVPITRIAGGDVFIVRSASMAPDMTAGAAFAIQRTVDVEVGDVVTVRLDGVGHLTHRVTRVVDREDGRWFELKGDANERPDPTLVPAEAVVGRVTAVVPVAGYVLAFVASMPGRLALLSFGLLLVTVRRLLGPRSPVPVARVQSASELQATLLPSLVLLIGVGLTGTSVVATAALFADVETIDAIFLTAVW